jgi:hypothetical protein
MKSAAAAIVSTENGNVGLLIEGERAEHRALRKKFSQEVTVAGVTLTVGDFSFCHEGVPSYCESLASLVHSIVHTLTDEEAKIALKQLCSVVTAARRLAHEMLGRNDHARFRSYLTHLRKQFGRDPTRREILQAMFPATPREKVKDKGREIQRLCHENGVKLLSGARPGRPKKIAVL